jgi:Icc protein
MGDMEPLKIALIADVHHGPDTPLKLGSRALVLLEEVMSRVNDTEPRLVVDLGDRITDTGLDDDHRRLDEVGAVMARSEVPRQHLLGNHDLALLSREANEEALGCQLRNLSIEIQGWHLVFWQVDNAFKGDRGLVIDEADFEWLAGDLRATSLPTVVFTHAPLDGGPMLGNYYFESGAPQFAGYQNSARARGLFEASSVVVCVSGHVHWNSIRTVRGIHYITVQSLSECFTTYPRPSQAWGLLTLGRDIALSVFGNDPLTARLPLRRFDWPWLRAGSVRDDWNEVVTRTLEGETA